MVSVGGDNCISFAITRDLFWFIFRAYAEFGPFCMPILPGVGLKSVGNVVVNYGSVLGSEHFFFKIMYVHDTTMYVHDTTMYVHDTTMYVHDPTMYVHDATLYVHNTTMYVHDAAMYVHNTTMYVRNTTFYVHDTTIYVHDSIVYVHGSIVDVHHLKKIFSVLALIRFRSYPT